MTRVYGIGGISGVSARKRMVPLGGELCSGGDCQDRRGDVRQRIGATIANDVSGCYVRDRLPMQYASLLRRVRYHEPETYTVVIGCSDADEMPLVLAVDVCLLRAGGSKLS